MAFPLSFGICAFDTWEASMVSLWSFRQQTQPIDPSVYQLRRHLGAVFDDRDGHGVKRVQPDQIGAVRSGALPAIKRNR